MGEFFEPHQIELIKIRKGSRETRYIREAFRRRKTEKVFYQMRWVGGGIPTPNNFCLTSLYPYNPKIWYKPNYFAPEILAELYLEVKLNSRIFDPRLFW
jgi:hypothetical protein